MPSTTSLPGNDNGGEDNVTVVVLQFTEDTTALDADSDRAVVAEAFASTDRHRVVSGR